MQTTFLKKQSKIGRYRMKWIILPYSESYFEETKYILVKFLPIFLYSRILLSEYPSKTRMNRLEFFSLFHMPTLLPNLHLMRSLCFTKEYMSTRKPREQNWRKSKRFQLLDTEFKNCIKGFSVTTFIYCLTYTVLYRCRCYMAEILPITA